VIHVDELSRLGDVKNDVKPADRFFFRNLKGRFGGPEVFAFGGIFCPLTVAGEILERFGVFDKDVHELRCYHIFPNHKHSNRQIRVLFFTGIFCG
jgi:hypothetical protein